MYNVVREFVQNAKPADGLSTTLWERDCGLYEAKRDGGLDRKCLSVTYAYVCI